MQRWKTDLPIGNSGNAKGASTNEQIKSPPQRSVPARSGAERALQPAGGCPGQQSLPVEQGLAHQAGPPAAGGSFSRRGGGVPLEHAVCSTSSERQQTPLMRCGSTRKPISDQCLVSL